MPQACLSGDHLHCHQANAKQQCCMPDIVCQSNGRGLGPGTAAAHWEAPVVPQQGGCSALPTHPLPEPTASSLVVEGFSFFV